MNTATSPSREESIKRILDLIRVNDISRTNPVNDARERLNTYSDSTIDILAIATSDLQENRRPTLISDIINETDEHTVREVIHLHTLCSRETAPKYENYYNLISIIRGLHQISHFKDVENLETLAGEDLKIAAAFINITSAMKRYLERPELTIQGMDSLATSSIHIDNPAVQKLIIEHRDKVAEIVVFLKEGNPEHAGKALSGLPYLRWFKEQDLNSVDGETIEKAISFLRITASLLAHTRYQHLTRSGADWNYPAMHIHNDAFEALIDQNYQSADAIIDYIKDRGSADPETLSHYLENGTALKTGAL